MFVNKYFSTETNLVEMRECDTTPNFLPLWDICSATYCTVMLMSFWWRKHPSHNNTFGANAFISANLLKTNFLDWCKNCNKSFLLHFPYLIMIHVLPKKVFVPWELENPSSPKQVAAKIFSNGFPLILNLSYYETKEI